MATKHKVFVYGTLRGLAKQSEATHTLTNYAMYDYGRFPYIVEDENGDDSEVLGNVIEVTEKELKELDRYEGVERGLYTRNTVEVHDDSGVAVKCFVYVATNNIHPRRIESGDWYNKG